MLTMAAARTEHGLRCAVGARLPGGAGEGADEAELLERVQSLTWRQQPRRRGTGPIWPGC